MIGAYRYLIRSLRLTVLSLTLTSLASCSATKSPRESDANSHALLEILQTNFATSAGGQKSLSDLQGRIVLVNFFASWCAECAQEVSSLKNLAASFEGTDFSVVGVAVSDDPVNAKQFVSRLQIPYPVLLDPAGELKQFFSIKELPVTLILDRGGRPLQFQDPKTGAVTAKFEGGRRWDTAQPVEMIAGLVEGR
jgi:peroxiredoxin